MRKTGQDFRATHKSTWLFRPHWRGTFVSRISQVVLKTKTEETKKNEFEDPTFQRGGNDCLFAINDRIYLPLKKRI